jgi:hypothetical protein
MLSIVAWTRLLSFIQASQRDYRADRLLSPWLTTALQLLLVVGILVFIIYLVLAERPRVEDTLGHWHATIPGLKVMPARFYETLTNEVDRPASGPPVDIKTVNLSEGSVYFRPYLQIRHQKLAYYVFAAPLGKSSFFVSSWLVIRRPTLGRIIAHLPIISWLFSGIARLFGGFTFFTYDAALHFHETTHAALLRTIDKLTSIENVAALPPEIRRPVMRELYAPPAAPQLPLGL